MEIKMTLNRFYTNDMDTALKFYETLFSENCTGRFFYEALNLEIAKIGPVLLIAGTDEALAPFRSTLATFLVDSVHEYREFLVECGAEIVREIQHVPTGLNMTVKHIDGTLAEYVEHR